MVGKNMFEQNYTNSPRVAASLPLALAKNTAERSAYEPVMRMPRHSWMASIGKGKTPVA
jgi:hypothetical protein